MNVGVNGSILVLDVLLVVPACLCSPPPDDGGGGVTSVMCQSAWVGCLCRFSEGGAVGQSVEERRLNVAALQAVFKATGFPFHIVPLEQVCTRGGFTPLSDPEVLILQTRGF